LIEPLKPIVYYIDPATPEKENSSNKELTIGKLPSKMLDGKMRFVVNIGQKMIHNEFRRCSLLRYSLLIFKMHMDLMFMILELEKSWRVTLDGITTL
jgi:hypothetical protein